MTILLIGDIHGCFTELLDLLDKAGLSDSDRAPRLSACCTWRAGESCHESGPGKCCGMQVKSITWLLF